MRTENKDKELNHRHFIGLRLTDGIESIHSMITETLFLFIKQNNTLRRVFTDTTGSVPPWTRTVLVTILVGSVTSFHNLLLFYRYFP